MLSARVTYEISKLSMQLNEVSLGKRVLYAESKIFNRKWYAFSKMVDVVEDIDAAGINAGGAAAAAGKDDKKKKDVKKPAAPAAAAGKKDEKKEDTGNAVSATAVQAKITKKLIRELYETQSTV